MKLGKKLKSLRKRLRSRMASASLALAGGKRRKGTKRYSRRQRGGYSQYQNNMPVYNTYSTGGILSPKDSALANPVPIDKVFNSAVDNLNANTMQGFPSRGH